MSFISKLLQPFSPKVWRGKDYTVRTYGHMMKHVCYCVINDKEYPIHFNKSMTKSYVIRKSEKTGKEYRQYFVPDMNKTIETFRMKYPKTSFLIIKNK